MPLAVPHLSRSKNNSIFWLSSYFALLIFALLFWQISTNDSLAVSFWTLLLTVTLTVSFAAYIFRQTDNASIWYFNFQLTAGICFAVLTALILCGGLSMILKSMEYLFELKINRKYYLDIWLTGWCFFAPTYFLTSVPTQFDYQRSDCEFPRGVHFIQNYVLVPLSLIFMVILYAYFIKILLQWELPRGNLGKMISFFGVIGIFTHLTIYPVHDRGTLLLNWFYRNFYKMMIVPLGLLTLAIVVRISEYGLTEPRYMVVICTIWFATLIGYYLIKGTNFQIKNVTIVLALLGLIASFGPWRIDKLPVQDQFARLQTLLIEKKLLISNQYIAPKTQADFKTRKSISSIIGYIISHGGGEKLLPWFAESEQAEVQSLIDCDGRKCHYSEGSRLVEYMGIDYVGRWQTTENETSFRISLRDVPTRHYGIENKLVPVDDFDYLISVKVYKSACKKECTARTIDQSWLSTKTEDLKVYLKEDNTVEIVSGNYRKIIFDFNILLEQIQKHGNVELPTEDAHKLVLDQSVKGIKARLLIDQISGVVKNKEKQISVFEGMILLKFIE